MSSESSPTDNEEYDYRRWSDNILHWQERPYVYPFSNVKDNTVQTAPAAACSTYTSEFVTKPIVYRKMRPFSISRRNKPHPQMAFNFSLALNKSFPVVRTKLTEADLNKRPVQSPLVSTTHRAYRLVKPKAGDRARIARSVERAANGVVPELSHGELNAEVRLFPVIPRNARLTADRADKISNAMIKPHSNKYQPHLKAEAGDVIYRNDLVADFVRKPRSKPVPGQQEDSLEVEMFNGSPTRNAKTTSKVYGRKKMDSTKIHPAAVAVIPEIAKPQSKKIMFNDYTQYPKFAPQIFEEFYRKKRHVQKPTMVW